VTLRSRILQTLRAWKATSRLLVTGLSREFLSAFDEGTIDGIIRSFVTMSDWPLIEQNIKVDLAVDVREQAKKIKAPTLSITAKYDQIVPPSILRNWLI
jgi:pimeloyl-ACP methyl ester carboxylesterase